MLYILQPELTGMEPILIRFLYCEIREDFVMRTLYVNPYFNMNSKILLNPN